MRTCKWEQGVCWRFLSFFSGRISVSSTILFLLIFPCSVYTLPLHLIQPSGSPLHFVTFQHKEGRVNVEVEKKKEKLQTSHKISRSIFFFLHNSPSVSLILSALHPSLPPSLRPSQSQSRLTQALACEASSIDPIKLVVGTVRLEELSPKPSV